MKNQLHNNRLTASATVAVGLFLLPLAGPAQNLLTNGDYENQPDWFCCGVLWDGGFTALTNNQVPGWTIEPGHAATIHIRPGPFLGISGRYSLNTDGEGFNGHNANLYQDFGTYAGTNYLLTFNWQSWNYISTILNTNVQLHISLTDTATSAVLFDGLYSYDVGGPYRVHFVSTNFTGTGNPLRLRVQQTPESGVNDDMFVADNFSVTAGSTSPAGALQVTITPPGAASAGAQWQVDGGAFQASGAVVTNLSAAAHTISFNSVSNWVAPLNQTLTLSAFVTNLAYGPYSLAQPNTYVWSLKSWGQIYDICAGQPGQFSYAYYPSNQYWIGSLETNHSCNGGTIVYQQANWDPLDTNAPPLGVGAYPCDANHTNVNVIIGPANAPTYGYSPVAIAEHFTLNKMTIQEGAGPFFSYGITANEWEFQGDCVVQGGDLLTPNGGTVLKSCSPGTYSVLSGGLYATNDLFEVDEGTLVFPSGYSYVLLIGATFAVSNNATLLLTADNNGAPFLGGTITGVGGGTVLVNDGYFDAYY